MKINEKNLMTWEYYKPIVRAYLDGLADGDCDRVACNVVGNVVEHRFLKDGETWLKK